MIICFGKLIISDLEFKHIHDIVPPSENVFDFVIGVLENYLRSSGVNDEEIKVIYEGYVDDGNE